MSDLELAKRLLAKAERDMDLKASLMDIYRSAHNMREWVKATEWWNECKAQVEDLSR